MPNMGLVLQGGGGLGAYEYGAVTRLVELGWQPTVVTGVSIGAITAAAIAGARDGDICASLKRLWDAITLMPVPFIPPDRQATLSIFGNPHFWRSRSDYLAFPEWTSYCDVSPMHQTLSTICDFARLNDASKIRISVTATNVASGNQITFSNYVAKPDAADVRASKVLPITLTPDHILASGSLPPGFPMTVIEGVAYWDGGLFDNTPIEALLDLLVDPEIDQLPIFVVNLFPTGVTVPRNLFEVQERMLEISYENRFWAEYEGPDTGLGAFTDMLEALARELPPDSPVRAKEPFRRLQRMRALKNLKLIQADHAPMSGGSDFSAYGVRKRFDSGYAAVDAHFAGASRPALTGHTGSPG
jgi:NTE family protein